MSTEGVRIIPIPRESLPESPFDMLLPSQPCASCAEKAAELAEWRRSYKESVEKAVAEGLREAEAECLRLREQIALAWRPIADAPKRDNYIDGGEPCMFLSPEFKGPWVGSAAMYPDGIVRGNMSHGNGGPIEWGVTHFILLADLLALPKSDALQPRSETR